MKSGRSRASTTAGSALGAMAVVVVFVAGIASAGFLAVVYVGGLLASDVGDWTQATTTGYGLNGDVLFGFTMDQEFGDSSILYLWGDETLGSDGYWHCHNAP